ncbi:MAG: hypothetical protein SFU27_13415, partial [Thermonemataceae bacterium]|nr:hypothetical protein [Thermonemataceae bacterium]
MKNVLLLLSFYTFAFLGRAQDMYYFVPFQNKIGTPFEIENPLHFLSQKAIEKRQKENISITEQDLPVNPAYTNQIKAKGATILYTSKWFNGVVILCSESSLNQIKDLTFVKANEIRMIKNRVDVESERRKKEKRSLKNHQKHKKTHFKEQISKYEYGSSYTQNQMIGA